MSGSTSWTIWWDMHRHPSEDAWSRAMEKTEEEAVQRVQRFLKLGFVVHEIRAPKGSVFMDEAQITGRFGKRVSRYRPERRRPRGRGDFDCERSRSD